MRFSKSCLFVVVVTILIASFVPQSNATHKLGEEVAKKFKEAKSKFDVKAGIGGDGNVIIALGEKAIKEIHDLRLANSISGKIGEAIEMFADGWESTLKYIADTMDEAWDLFDTIMSKQIDNREEALSALIFGLDKVRDLTYDSAIGVHSSLGPGMSVGNIKHRGGLRYAVDKVEETGSGLFEDLDVAQFFAIQGVNAQDPSVTKKCLEAAHDAIKAGAETAFYNYVEGAKKLIGSTSIDDEKLVMEPEKLEKMISEASKKAAALDPDTVRAKEALMGEFEMASALGINATFLDQVKTGVEKYIDYSAWSVIRFFDMLNRALLVADKDPALAIRLIENETDLCCSLLVDGSVHAYENMGIAGYLTETLEYFKRPMAIAERCRIEGCQGYKNANTAAIRAIKTGGIAVRHGFDAAHKMLEANELVIFERIHKICDLAFDMLSPGGVHGGN